MEEWKKREFLCQSLLIHWNHLVKNIKVWAFHSKHGSDQQMTTMKTFSGGFTVAGDPSTATVYGKYRMARISERKKYAAIILTASLCVMCILLGIAVGLHYEETMGEFSQQIFYLSWVFMSLSGLLVMCMFLVAGGGNEVLNRALLVIEVCLLGLALSITFCLSWETSTFASLGSIVGIFFLTFCASFPSFHSFDMTQYHTMVACVIIAVIYLVAVVVQIATQFQLIAFIVEWILLIALLLQLFSCTQQTLGGCFKEYAETQKAGPIGLFCAILTTIVLLILDILNTLLKQ